MKDSDEASIAAHGRSSIAALIDVARGHGIHLSIEQIERDYPLGGSEPPFPFLLQLAERYGLKGRIVRMQWRQLIRLGRAVPAILRMQNGTAMVAIGCRGDGPVPMVLLQDPLDDADGVVAIDEA